MPGVPDRFGEDFLDWFRDATERAWADAEPRTLEDYVAAGVGGLGWQRGTRWIGGTSESEIDAIEKQAGLAFPPDYRLFLRRLFATDRPMVGALFKGRTLKPASAPGLYHWKTDAAFIRGAHEGVLGGLVFDVEHNSLWKAEWGKRPSTKKQREAVVRKAVAAAPKLIALFGHRFLLAEPCSAGNPVLSIHQSDIIVYGTDLRNYLLNEFRDLTGVKIRQTGEAYDPAHIPFWGEFA